jgi:maltose alpha-D-glucosyltransferase / alpha-amylase
MVDFEGEPARPLEERREKQSPLRDVAGMLRSFSYAARSALDKYLQRRPDSEAALAPWAALWENAISTAFLQAYRDTVRKAPDLVPEDAEAQTLLLTYVLEKALYELLYELNNRPTWMHIPLNGLLTLLRAPSTTA